MGFDGFPDRLLDFYEGLEADNSKAYWTDHKAVYEECVAAPMRALLGELEPEFGPAKLFRPYRDVRFSADKSPYKTQVAAVVGSGHGALYVAVGADGLLVAGGLWRASTEQARRLRDAAADDGAGPALVRTLADLAAAGFATGGEELKRVPRPWDAGHPRADLLRLKSLTGSRQDAPEVWLHTPAARERVEEGWRALGPLNAWLREHVLGAPQT